MVDAPTIYQPPCDAPILPGKAVRFHIQAASVVTVSHSAPTPVRIKVTAASTPVASHEPAPGDPQPQLSSTGETQVDTSTQAVERLAERLDIYRIVINRGEEVIAGHVLRALAAKLDASEQGRIEAARLAAEKADQLGEMRAERDALAAQVRGLQAEIDQLRGGW